MAMLKNVNFMSEERYDSITPADDELYAVNIMLVGFPDYANSISTTEAEYTCPDNGWLYVQMMGISEANTWGYAYINGAEVGCVQSKASRSLGDSSMFIPVLKGDVLTFDGNINTGLTKIFYPFMKTKIQGS